MEKLTNILSPQKKSELLRVSWEKASNYPDVDWTPANQYVSMLEKKIIEDGNTIELLYAKINSLRTVQKKLMDSLEKSEAIDELRKLWAKGEIEN